MADDKKYDMKPEESLEKFFHAMEDGMVYMEDGVSFTAICRRLNVSRTVLDGCLRDNFGLSGDEIIEIYRRGIPLPMWRAQGVKD